MVDLTVDRAKRAAPEKKTVRPGAHNTGRLQVQRLAKAAKATG